MGMVLKLEAAWRAFRHADGLDRCHGQPGRAPLAWSRIGRRTHMTQAPPPPDPNDPLGSPGGSVPPPPVAPQPRVAPPGAYPPATAGADAPPAGYGASSPSAAGYGATPEPSGGYA